MPAWVACFQECQQYHCGQGLGYGLPVAQTYIEYFGGRLTIMPVEGYGTDAFIYLPRIADIKEPLS